MGFHQLVHLEIDPPQPEFTNHHSFLQLFWLLEPHEPREDVEVVLGNPSLHLGTISLKVYYLIHYLKHLYQFLRISANHYHYVHHFYNLFLNILIQQSFQQFSYFTDWLGFKSKASTFELFKISFDYEAWLLFCLLNIFYHSEIMMKYFVSSFKAENVYKNKGKRQFGFI